MAPLARCLNSCNFRGVCAFLGGIFQCICDMGYRGESCEIEAVNSTVSTAIETSETSGSFGILVCISVFFILSLLGVILCVIAHTGVSKSTDAASGDVVHPSDPSDSDHVAAKLPSAPDAEVVEIDT
ncbi:unnamed protein product [Caenorhabditis nigoni]